jgi:hypothetical protein
MLQPQQKRLLCTLCQSLPAICTLVLMIITFAALQTWYCTRSTTGATHTVVFYVHCQLPNPKDVGRSNFYYHYYCYYLFR